MFADYVYLGLTDSDIRARFYTLVTGYDAVQLGGGVEPEWQLFSVASEDCSR